MRSGLLYLFLLPGHWLFAQQNNYTVTHYTTANGLADNSVNSIIQDRRGFMWFGTKEGLSRFDGTSFKNFYARKNDSTGLPGNNISSLLEYKPGHLLLTTNGIVTSFNTVAQQFSVIKELANKISYAVTELHNGLYCVSTQGSLFFLNRDLKIIDSISPPLKYKGMVPVALEINNDTWIIGTTQEYFFYNPAKKIFTVFAPGHDFSTNESSIILRYYDKKKQWLYFYNYHNGLFRYSLDGTILHNWKRGNKKGDLPDGNIRFIVPKNDSILWIGGAEGGGVMSLNIYNNNIQSLTDTKSYIQLLNNGVLMNYTDKDNNEWISTTAGLSKLTNTTRTVISWQESFKELSSNDILLNVLKGSDQNMYVSGFGSNYCYQIDPLTNKVSRLEKDKLPYTWCLADFKKEIVFTGGAAAITKYNPKTNSYEQSNFLKSLFPTSDVVILAFKHSNGDEWYSGNNGGGFVRISAQDNSVHRYQKNGPRGTFTVSYYSSYIEDKKGDIWFGVNKTNKLLHYNYAKDIFSEVALDTVKGIRNIIFSGITDITMDQVGDLWVSFDGSGILKYNPSTNTALHFTIQDGLPTNYVYALKFDGANRLWIGTLRGLSCLLVKENRFVTFKKEDGLPADYFEERCLYYDSVSHQFWAGSKNTLMRFNPDSLLASTKKQFPVYVDEIVVNGKRYSVNNTGSISFDPSQNNFLFRFVAVDINNGKDLEYSYRLTGADKDWIYNSNIQTASYANLSSGNYSFLVRARHKGDNEWIEMQGPLTFSIATPWFKTTGFRLAAIAAIAFLLWFIIRTVYLRKMERQKMMMEKDLAIEQERTRMARELHDGLGSMLSGLKHSFTALQNQLTIEESQKQKFNYNIEKLNETIKELRDISNSMASENTMKYGLENAIRDYCNFISQSSGIPVTCSTLNTSNTKLDEDRAFHVFRIIQELLQNIIKHSDATNAIVQTSINEGQFYITVEDDGKGFDYTAAIKQGGMGLKNIKSRVKILKGKLDYQISEDKGTSVLIEFPC